MGTAGAVATSTRDNVSLLVRIEHEQYLVDCSGSPVQRLLRAGGDYRASLAVIITHRHPDHLYGLPALLHSRMICSGELPPLNIYAPDETIAVISKLLNAFWQRERVVDYVSLIPIRPVENHLLLETSDAQILTNPVEHGPETVAVKFVERKTANSLVYSSDTSPCDGLVSFASGASDLIHDCTFCDQEEASRATGHSTAKQAGFVARRADVERLILTHFGSKAEDTVQCVREAASFFDKEIVAASDMQEFICGAGL